MTTFIAVKELETHLCLPVTFPDGCDAATQAVVINGDDAVIGGAFVDYPGDVVDSTFRIFPRGSTAYLQNGVHTFWPAGTLTVESSCTVDGDAVTDVSIVEIPPSVIRNDIGYTPNADVAALLAFPFTGYCSTLFEDLKVRLSSEEELSGRLFFDYAADTPLRGAFGGELDSYRGERYVSRARILSAMSGFNPDFDRFLAELERGGVSASMTGVLRSLYESDDPYVRLSAACAGLVALSRIA